MIVIRKLKKIVTNKCILNIPDLTFEESKIHGIIGKNGSGKSTLLRIILNLEKATTGHILINGMVNSSNESWKKEIGAFLDDDFLINFLTAEEYFELLFRLRGKNLKSYADFVLRMNVFFAREVLGQKKPIDCFSKGNRQKIGIAGSLIGDIKTLILDEPMSHLDPNAQEELKKLLKTFNRESNLTIIMSSHDHSLKSGFFDNVITLSEGEIKYD